MRIEVFTVFDSLKFHQKVDKCCKLRGTNITQMLKTLGLSTSFGTNWKNGRSPTADVVKRVAEYLNVSSDYLLSINVEQDPLILSDDEITVLTLFRQLKKAEQIKLIDRLGVSVNKHIRSV